MKRFFYSIASLLLFIGCNSSVKNETIYFGGQIKNPKDDTVYILKNDSKIAQAKLSQEHKFMFKLDSLTPGLYKFKHGEEYQYIYLEKKDSLLIRLNTWDFDGSLVFSGKGANRNNFLIQLFLENEQEEKQYYNFFKLNEKEFLSKIDSFTKLKENQFKIFKKNTTKQSSNFNDLIKSIIYLPIYANKEEYPLYYKKHYNSDKLPKLSSNYYNHRNIINKNTNHFKDYYTYNSYLWSNIYNTSFYQIEKDTLSELSAVLLTQISKIIKDVDIKNNMLQQTYINSLFDSSCSDVDKEKTKSIFYKNCNNVKKKEKVTNILSVINTLKKHSKLPEFYLKTIQDNTVNSNSLIGSNMVIYFWPKELNRIQNMAKRVNFLVKKYPKIRFIGIDGQLSNYNWKAYAKANDLDLSNQFQFVEHNKNIFYTNDYPRAIVIDKEGFIQSNFTFISHGNFEKELLSIKNNTVKSLITNK
ncbi:MAG TPA: hypothetical protein EYG80_05310 [Flavobacteriaceae bacterium]|nr:hypothetical protein [Flavobacteriaceae bacterium]